MNTYHLIPAQTIGKKRGPKPTSNQIKAPKRARKQGDLVNGKVVVLNQKPPPMNICSTISSPICNDAASISSPICNDAASIQVVSNVCKTEFSNSKPQVNLLSITYKTAAPNQEVLQEDKNENSSSSSNVDVKVEMSSSSHKTAVSTQLAIQDCKPDYKTTARKEGCDSMSILFKLKPPMFNKTKTKTYNKRQVTTNKKKACRGTQP